VNDIGTASVVNDIGTASVRTPVARLLRPRSIAIVGASPTPGALGNQVLESLQQFQYAGEIYLINPNREEINGRPCVRSVKELPMGVDCAVFAIPSKGVVQALTDCGERGVGGVIIFSAGYAEAGPAGRAEQEVLANIAHAHNMAIEGPNCSGMTNYLDGVPLTFASSMPIVGDGRPGLGLVSQSGAAATATTITLREREVTLSFSVSTGNEGATGIEEFLEYVVEDETTRVVAVLAEQIRNPKKFVGLVKRARALGKPVVLLHTGKCEAARIAARTHTGAFTPDYDLVSALVQSEGVAMAQTLEEFIDIMELLMRCPSLPKGSPAMISDSGALKALAMDIGHASGLDLAPLSPETDRALRLVLPEFIPPSNPLDITAQGLVDPSLYAKTMGPMLADDRYGCLILGVILSNPKTSRRKIPLILDFLEELKPTKPVFLANFGEGADVPADLISLVRRKGVAFFRSPERLLRALARMNVLSAPLPERSVAVSRSRDGVQPLPHGVLSEQEAKSLLKQAGIASDPEAGATVREGLNLFVSARNHPDWGPVLSVRLGDPWATVLKDRAIFRADLTPEAIASEIKKLQGSALLTGGSDRAAIDIEAVAQTVSRLGALITDFPEIQEIELNPLVAYAKGEGVAVRHASIVAR
jgi:acyl-CoA synthetase (NDP forming)